MVIAVSVLDAEEVSRQLVQNGCPAHRYVSGRWVPGHRTKNVDSRTVLVWYRTSPGDGIRQFQEVLRARVVLEDLGYRVEQVGERAMEVTAL